MLDASTNEQTNANVTGDFSQVEVGNSMSRVNIEEAISATDLHSTSAALNLLSQAAHLDTHGRRGQYGPSDGPVSTPLQTHNDITEVQTHGSLHFPLVSQGNLTTAQVVNLVAL
jgi:hypothetical protein